MIAGIKSVILALLPHSPQMLALFLIQSTVFLALVFFVDKLLRRKGAVLKSQMWLLAILAIPFLNLVQQQFPATQINYLVQDYVGASMFAAPANDISCAAITAVINPHRSAAWSS